MQIRQIMYPTVRGTHDQFVNLISQAKAWDQTFENATGTYPTREFAEGYRAFTDRVRHAQDDAKRLGSIVSYEFDRLARHDLWRDYVGITSSVLGTLDRMAASRTPFRPYKGGGVPPWGSLLDGIVHDLQRGERMLYAKLITMNPAPQPAPNPGVPGGSTPRPGGPRPTPIPGA